MMPSAMSLGKEILKNDPLAKQKCNAPSDANVMISSILVELSYSLYAYIMVSKNH